MKTKYLLLSVISIVILFLLTSCPAPPPADGPYISIIQDVDTVYFDTTKNCAIVTFTLRMQSDIISEVFLSNLVISEGKNELFNEDFGNSISDTTKTFEYFVSDTIKSDTTLTLTFEVTDDNGNSCSEKAKIVVLLEPQYLEIIMSSGKTVNYNSTSTTTEFGWRITEDGPTITIVNSSEADLVFFFNDTYRQQILSPDAEQIEVQDTFSLWSYDLAGKHTTKIQKVTTSDWINATAITINELTVISGTHAGGGNGYAYVQVDDVYAFELSDGRKGLCKVLASNPPYKSPSMASTITLDFIYQNITNSGK
jgi:hypothetical protein